MALSLDQFTKLLTDSGLISSDDLVVFTGSLPDDQKPTDAESLARTLIEAKKLTPFQATEIWKGNTQQLVLGDYEILDKIGAGGMGEVYKARHRRMKRVVALKLLPASVTKNEQAVQRFEREVEAAAKLSHPNIVTAHDAGEHNGINYLVMENVEGSDLSAIVKKQGPATVEQSINCVLQAARGLEYAHKHGVIHRDIKPANLLFDREGTVKILDMGLARIDDTAVDQPTQMELTGTGTIMGTIDYMAPEQALNTKHADAKSDIYSLGVTLHYLLLGKSMVEGDTVGEKMKSLVTATDDDIPSLPTLRNEVPAELDAVFRKMVAPEPANRYQSMAEVITDLEAIHTGTVPTSTSSFSGIQPVVVDDAITSGMATFLSHLESEKVETGQTITEIPQKEKNI